MNKIFSISMVLVLILSGMLAIAPTSIARSEQDSKLKIENVSWNKASQEFIVEMSCKFGITKAGEHANFLIDTELKIDVDDHFYVLESKDKTIQMLKNTEKGENGYIELEPKHIPWDRNGGSEEGKGIVTVFVGIKNPKGRFIGNDPVGFTVGEISFAPPSRPIYVVNGNDNTVSVIDSSKIDDGISGNEIIDLIDLEYDGHSIGIDVDGSRDRVYVTSQMLIYESWDRVSVIDETTIHDGISGNEIADVITWDIPPVGYPPSGASFFGVNACEFHQIIWVTAPNLRGVFAFNALTGDLIYQILLLNGGLPIGVEIDEFRDLVYVASLGTNTVDVIDENRIFDGIPANEVIESIDVGTSPYGLSFDSIRNRVYVTNQDDNTVSVIDGSKVNDGISGNEIMETIAVGEHPTNIALDPSRNRFYVTNRHDGTVSVIDGSKVNDKIFGNEVIDTIEVGNEPFGIAVDRSDNKIYVTLEADNSVAVIDGVRVDDGVIGNEVIIRISVGNGPLGVAVSNFALP
jgi:YVTN family beta-propeller protein